VHGEKKEEINWALWAEVESAKAQEAVVQPILSDVTTVMTCYAAL